MAFGKDETEFKVVKKKKKERKRNREFESWEEDCENEGKL